MSKVLVVVDMQNDFIDGALGTKEAQAVVPKVVDKINKFDGKVIFTQDTHDKDYLVTQEGKNLPVEHCVIGTNGWEICKELTVHREQAMSYEKDTFGSKYLAKNLSEGRYGNVDEIELIGVCTDICVISNALLFKAFLPEVKITVDASACAGVTPESHKTALEAMKMCQINIINE